MTFQPDQSPNPRGRPPGSKNKIGRDFHDAYEEAKAKGYKHPYLVMVEWAHDETKPLEIRAAMLKECASYTCTKPKLTVRSEVPVLSSVEQAEFFLATLAVENDFDPIELMTVIKHWIESKRAGQELQLKITSQNGGSDQTIRIEGGLPPLSGCNIIGMGGEPHTPVMNGHSNSHVIDHQEPPTLTEFVVSEGGEKTLLRDLELEIADGPGPIRSNIDDKISRSRTDRFRDWTARYQRETGRPRCRISARATPDFTTAFRTRTTKQNMARSRATARHPADPH